MLDGGRVVGGLFMLLSLGAGPVWLVSVRGAKHEAPVVTRRKDGCVIPTAQMRREHPTLLAHWRRQAVRMGSRHFRAANGRTYAISLSGTCLGCHGPAAAFCDRCHAEVGVQLTCWQCHPSSGLPTQQRGP